jgi:hypothetical protein
MNEFLKSLEKIFNTLTKETIRERYHVDVTFRVYNETNYIIFVEFVGDFPLTYRNYDYDGWDYYRYHTNWNIRRLLQKDSEYLSNVKDIQLSYPDIYNQECFNTIYLESVDDHICEETGITEDGDMHLNDIDNIEWWEKLSDRDKSLLEKHFG